MAWSDKPTDDQVSALFQDNFATLYEAVDTAEERGAYIAADAIKAFLEDDTLLLNAIRKIPTRSEISKWISRPCSSPKAFAKPVQDLLNEFFKGYDFDLAEFL